MVTSGKCSHKGYQEIYSSGHPEEEKRERLAEEWYKKVTRDMETD